MLDGGTMTFRFLSIRIKSGAIFKHQQESFIILSLCGREVAGDEVEQFIGKIWRKKKEETSESSFQATIGLQRHTRPSWPAVTTTKSSTEGATAIQVNAPGPWACTRRTTLKVTKSKINISPSAVPNRIDNPSHARHLRNKQQRSISSQLSPGEPKAILGRGTTNITENLRSYQAPPFLHF